MANIKHGLKEPGRKVVVSPTFAGNNLFLNTAIHPNANKVAKILPLQFHFECTN